MRKTGNAIGVATAAVVAAAISPNDCRNLSPAVCAAPEPEQYHIHERGTAQIPTERVLMAANSGASLFGMPVEGALQGFDHDELVDDWEWHAAYSAPVG
jgi:hypothetical protein